MSDYVHTNVAVERDSGSWEVFITRGPMTVAAAIGKTPESALIRARYIVETLNEAMSS